MALAQALALGPARQLARRLLPPGPRAAACTARAHLDAFDEAFLAHFKGIDADAHGAHRASCCEWLKDPRKLRGAHRRGARRCSRRSTSRSCAQLFEQRLKEQKERHDGGNRWIGTGGTSPFGTRRRSTRRACASAARAAAAARCRSPTRAGTRPYRSDLVLDVRQIERGAAQAARVRPRGRGPTSSTSTGPSTRPRKNAGELEVVTRPPRRPNTRVLLLMDVGGSMDPHAAARVAAVHARRSAPRTSRSCAPTTSTTASTAASTRPSASPSRMPVPELLARRAAALQAGHRRRRADGTRTSCCAARADGPIRRAGARGHRLADAARASTSTRRVWLNPEPPSAWRARRRCDAIRQGVPDVPAHARRARRGRHPPRAAGRGAGLS